jgi:hypothetical protein
MEQKDNLRRDQPPVDPEQAIRDFVAKKFFQSSYLACDEITKTQIDNIIEETDFTDVMDTILGS